MTLVLPGLAAAANKVKFGDLEAKCVENRKNFKIVTKLCWPF